MKINLSIIVPVHNEAEHLRSSITDFITRVPAEIETSLMEILLIENGSEDQTSEVCTKLHETFPQLIRVIPLDQPNYGEAVKKGIQECLGTHLAVLESDLLDIRFVESSLRLFAGSDARFIIASKCHPSSIDRRPMQRRILTLLLKYILKIGFGYPGSDTRGLKSMETALARRLCRVTVTTAEAFQSELVLIAWRMGIEVRELPIHLSELRPSPSSVTKRLKSSFDMLRELRCSIKGLDGRMASESDKRRIPEEGSAR